jgi:hypothetical protein
MRYLPSVTETMNPWMDFSGIPDNVLNHASERGTFVHDVCLNYHALGIPYMGEIPDDCVGFIESFRKWFDRIVPEVLAVEERLFDDVNGYSGQLDLLAGVGNEIWLIDIKTPAIKSKQWRVQLAAYDKLCQDCLNIHPTRVGSLRLNRDGKTPKMDWYEGSRIQDFNVFLSALNCHRFFKG